MKRRSFKKKKEKKKRRENVGKTLYGAQGPAIRHGRAEGLTQEGGCGQRGGRYYLIFRVPYERRERSLHHPEGTREGIQAVVSRGQATCREHGKVD